MGESGGINSSEKRRYKFAENQSESQHGPHVLGEASSCLCLSFPFCSGDLVELVSKMQGCRKR